MCHNKGNQAPTENYLIIVITVYHFDWVPQVTSFNFWMPWLLHTHGVHCVYLLIVFSCWVFSSSSLLLGYSSDLKWLECRCESRDQQISGGHLCCRPRWPSCSTTWSAWPWGQRSTGWRAPTLRPASDQSSSAPRRRRTPIGRIWRHDSEHTSSCCSTS